jgi:SAM-dependent methyltransferase
MSIRRNECLKLDNALVCDWEAMKHSYLSRFQQFGFSSRTLYYSRDQLHTDRLEQVSMLLREHVGPDERILDVGCGYGDVIPYLPACRYVGVDLIEDFVAEALHRYPAYEFRVGNLLQIEDPFDWVAMIGIMGTLPRPEEVLAKAASLCSKGLVVDFIDACKYTGDLNRYDLGQCANFLLECGMQQARVIATPCHAWTFIVATKANYFAEKAAGAC